MADGLFLLQAAADTTHAYRDFPLIGARAAVWIAAEVPLRFAAFVLGVPMFAVVTEAIGIFGGDERYDRLSKEFTRLLLVAYSATAIWGAILVFFLATLYPRFWAYLTAVFGPSMWAYAMLFFVESFTLYLYYYGWDRWKKGRAKLWHWTLGILLNVWGTIVMFIANSWLTYMMTPPRDITPTTDPTTIKLWHAIANATWMPINVHRLIANVVFGGAIVGAYASYRFLAARTAEERAHYDWMGYVAHDDRGLEGARGHGRIAPPVPGRAGRHERQEHRGQPDDPDHVPLLPHVPAGQSAAGGPLGRHGHAHPGGDVSRRRRGRAVLRHPRILRRGDRPHRIQRLPSPGGALLHPVRDRDRHPHGAGRPIARRDPVGQAAAALPVRALHPGRDVHLADGVDGIRALGNPPVLARVAGGGGYQQVRRHTRAGLRGESDQRVRADLPIARGLCVLARRTG